MPDFRRYFVEGGTYFFTVVTAGRRPIFSDANARTLLGDAFRNTLKNRPFELIAIVLLPDHLHSMWSLPRGDADYSTRWSAIKAEFTSKWLAGGGSEVKIGKGYSKQRRHGVWQPRFIEHTIRDQDDFHNHADYLHWNPVKHGLVTSVKDWPWSSFHRLVKTGDYPENWGSSRDAAPKFGNVDESLLE